MGVISWLANLQEENDKYHKIFSEIDADTNGYITKQDLKAAMEGYQIPLTEAELDAIYKAMDLESDDRIDYAEFVSAAYDRAQLLTESNLNQAWRIFDKDNDGNITKEEMQLVLTGKNNRTPEREELFKQQWEQILAEADLDKDGRICEQEFKLVMLKALEKSIQAKN